MCQDVTHKNHDLTDKNHDLPLMRQGVTHNINKVLINHYSSTHSHRGERYEIAQSSYYIY